ncbi:hypothetical protein Dimus_035024 [Dionaea muscipula]
MSVTPHHRQPTASCTEDLQSAHKHDKNPTFNNKTNWEIEKLEVIELTGDEACSPEPVPRQAPREQMARPLPGPRLSLRVTPLVRVSGSRLRCGRNFNDERERGIDREKSSEIQHSQWEYECCVNSFDMALDEAVRSGKVLPGHIIATSGFGAGLTWASAIVWWR